MKIIHTGDIHIGSALKGLPPQKAQIRKAELFEGFRRLARYAKEQGVSAVLIAGDLFDKNRLSSSIVKETLLTIASAGPVCFFYLTGNHDDIPPLSEIPENLYLFPQGKFTRYELGEGVSIGGAYPALPQETVFEKDKFNLLLAHGDISREPDYIDLSRLRNKNIDYLALGHIHQPMPLAEKLDGRGVYRYCGCLEGRGFDELGPRGFFLLEIENGKIQSEKYLTFSTREVLERRVDITGCNGYFDVEQRALQALENVAEGNIVKLVLCGTYIEGLKKQPALLSERLSKRFFFVKTEDESRLALDYKTFEKDVSFRGEFVREAGRYAMNNELREEVLEVGLKALAGEEIDL